MVEHLTVSPKGPLVEPCTCQLSLLLDKEFNHHWLVAQFVGYRFIGLRPHNLFAFSLVWKVHPSPLNYKNDCTMLAQEKETAAQSVVCSMVWGFCTLKRQGIGR